MTTKCVNCGKKFGGHYAMRCESGSDESIWEPSTEGTKIPDSRLREMVSGMDGLRPADCADTKEIDAMVPELISLRERIAQSEAREAELQARMEALERSHAKLLEAVNEALGCIDPGVYPDTVLELQEVKSAAEKL